MPAKAATINQKSELLDVRGARKKLTIPIADLDQSVGSKEATDNKDSSNQQSTSLVSA